MNTMGTSVERVLNRRASLLDNKTVPVHHETMSNLGTFLGETVLSEMSPIAKEMMHLDKPFPVAPKTVWLSPSDRNNGKFVLKPPPNEDVIKALTHEGILEIGSTVEKKLEEHWQTRIKEAKKEVEDFERFECNNRIKFALQQEKLAHEKVLKQQRSDLLKMFQKDRDELIEESKTEMETLEKKLMNEHELQRDIDIRMSVKQTQVSADQKISELTERINSLENELQDMQEMIVVEVEKRKNRDWQILQEMFIAMNRQFSAKLTILHNQHNAEIRQLYLELRTQVEDSERTTSYNEDTWNDESLSSELEQENIELSHQEKPFVINVCKVEGESSDEEKEDDHSNCSSFKCYRHRSKPKDSHFYEEDEPFQSKISLTESQSKIGFINNINTTDVSCNILRRLGLNFNMANIEKVKLELDNLMLNVSNRGETRFLTAADSLELLTFDLTKDFPIPESAESQQQKGSKDADREEYKRIMNRKKSKKLIDTKLAIPLTVDEYMNTLIPTPKYMETQGVSNISIWDYKAMDEDDWNNLLEEMDDKLHSESNESNSKSKSVTVTSPNSMESISISENFLCSSSDKKPVCSILRSSLDSKTDPKRMLKNEAFQTDQMQSLVKKFCDE
ncbi:FK506-binding protein 5-like isoform X2 [Bradysia coprophila]|uniref:FK506-binding protein 5-like isoform X2 n=1 Tax=Bradysia coprophila TaxID=38358 RepID=UPI00187D7BF7|nr:FK506-binding protein 5-like isoform X2 [Bradysia coprophila]